MVEPRNLHQRYCSKRCGTLARTVTGYGHTGAMAVPHEARTRPCELCRRPFVAASRDQRFCDMACSSRHTAQQRRAQRLAREAVVV